MRRVGEHPVPVGPLATRWLAYDVESVRAGVTSKAHLRLENAGSATWRSRGSEGVQVSYHWLDPLGNAIVWDGGRTRLPRPVPPGASADVELAIVGPRPPGRYRLAFDLVEEFRFWFEEVGCTPLDVAVDVEPRISERRLGVVVHDGASGETAAALAAQEEPVVWDEAIAVAHLVAGAAPAPDWSRLLLDAHEEGWAAVGGSVDAGSRAGGKPLRPWAPGQGRNPRFGSPLLFPSLLDDREPERHEGLPAFSGPDALFEGRAVVRLQSRSGRPRG